MEPDKSFVLIVLGVKFEIIPYLTKGERRVLRYRIIIRHFSPPSRQEFIATPHQMRALQQWVAQALVDNPPELEMTTSE